MAVFSKRIIGLSLRIKLHLLIRLGVSPPSFYTGARKWSNGWFSIHHSTRSCSGLRLTFSAKMFKNHNIGPEFGPIYTGMYIHMEYLFCFEKLCLEAVDFVLHLLVDFTVLPIARQDAVHLGSVQ
jgi:hypothetical protein